MIEFLGIALLFIIIFLSVCSIKYNNVFKLHFWFGDKGCGKTTNLTRLAFYWIRKGFSVYTNEEIPGTYKIDVNEIGIYEFPWNSVLMVDEGGIYYDNRKYKSFSDVARDYYKLQRHYGNIVYIFSQTWDIDVKLRVLTDQIYILRSYFHCISMGKRIMVKQDIVEATAESESRIVKNLKVMPFWIPGSRFFCWMPKYYKYFDSFSAPELLKKEWSMTPLPAGISPPKGMQRHFAKLGLCEYRSPWQRLKDVRKRSGPQDPGQEESESGGSQ